MNRSRERSDEEASHDLVLAVLRQAAGAMTVREVAAAVELSIATTRFHLTRLESDGLIRCGREHREHRPGRPQVLYTARRPEAVDSAAAYRHLAGVLAEQLMAVAGTAGVLDAGRVWSERLSSGSELPSDDRAAVEGVSPDGADRIVQLLDDAGFTPTLSEDRLLIELRSCPFISLAKERADVVCTVHLGLIQSLLADRGPHVRVRPVLDGSGPCRVELPAEQRFPPK